MAYLLYKKALASEIYQNIRDEAVRIMLGKDKSGADVAAAQGMFKKAVVLDNLGYGVLDIHWGHIRRMINENHNTDILPAKRAYFMRHRKADEIEFPKRYIASGDGARTWGYVNATAENDHFVLKILEDREGSTKRFAKSHDRVLRVATRIGIDGGRKALLPQLEEAALEPPQEQKLLEAS